MTPSAVRSRPDRPHGFTLAEVLIVLAVVATLAALITPTLAGLIQAEKDATTRAAAEEIFRAIVGNPAAGEFGFLGDMGRRPGVNLLSELIDPVTPAFHFTDATEHVGRVGTGWRGPYVRGLFSTGELLKDAWGQAFRYTADGKIVSGGPDGQVDPPNDADNLTFPLHAPLTTGTLFVSIAVNGFANPAGATAKIFSSVNGEQQKIGATRKHNSNDATFDGFIFENLPQGLHALVVAHTGESTANPGVNAGCQTVTRTMVVAVHEGEQVYREVRLLTDRVANVVSNPCTIPD